MANGPNEKDNAASFQESAIMEEYAGKGKVKQFGERFARDLCAAVENNTKIIKSSKGVTEAFDLGNDPKEARPLPGPLPDAFAGLDGKAAEILSGMRQSGQAGDAEAPVDKSIEENLRALGYL